MSHNYDTYYEDRINMEDGTVTSSKLVRSRDFRSSLKKINFKGTFMTYMTALEKSCKSGKDIGLVKLLLSGANDRNEIVFFVTAKAKELKCSRTALVSLLKRLVENQLLRRDGDGAYTINPYMFISIAMNRKADLAKKAQEEWLDEDN